MELSFISPQHYRAMLIFSGSFPSAKKKKTVGIIFANEGSEYRLTNDCRCPALITHTYIFFRPEKMELARAWFSLHLECRFYLLFSVGFYRAHSYPTRNTLLHLAFIFILLTKFHRYTYSTQSKLGASSPPTILLHFHISWERSCEV